MIRLLIVDDVAILRNSIKFMLEADKDIEVVGTASNGKEAYEMCRDLKPDIVLMDLKMPECDGVEGTKLIKKSFPEIKVMILTTFKEKEDVETALESGVEGYVLKDIEPLELIAAIKNTYKGLYSIHKSAFDSIAKKTKSPSIDDKSVPNLYDKNGNNLLSLQDKEIIRYLINGKSYREISKELFISEGHLRNQVSKILRKLELNDRMQLALFAVKHNIL
ncbi:MAG: response regulator transcription factor [Bacillota bacterium]|nr:response regulator transcription factor [Bacillota bacterium]